MRSALERAGVRYAIGGSWTSTTFGEPRFTNDVDILADFTEESLDRILGSLPETFCADPRRDILRIVRGYGVGLDRGYLEESAPK